MKQSLVLGLLAGVLAFSGCKKDAAAGTPSGGTWTDKVSSGAELYATMKTNLGSITLKLYSKDAPKTVSNFVGLSTGEKEWKHPATGEAKKGVPLYNGTVFHRVIDGFMIQGGDPLGTGTGNPGYQFEDEVQSGRTFDRTGLLAMANAGPATNGSQFFITTSKPTYLNGKHTIFGEVVKGYEVVEAISKVPRGPRDRPVQDVVVETITISDAP